jgi:hypothetical protein
VAHVSSGVIAGRTFAQIRDVWTRNDPAQRPQLRTDLQGFLEGFPHDGVAPLAKVLLVLSLLDPPEDFARATRLMDQLPALPPGSTHDLYVIGQAKLLRVHHQPEAAFELLRPLVGKMVDSRSRGLLQEELTLDALEAHQPYEAIAYMDAWLRGATDEDRDVAEAKVSVALAGVPEAALRGSLVAMREGGADSHGYGVAIGRLVAERLAKIAIEGPDVSLARWLLELEAAARLLDEETAGQLAALATSKRGIGSVVGRTLGVVLPTSSPDLRDEVADVLRGILWGLDLAHSEGSATEVRLVTRDDAGDRTRLVASLEDVAGEGATVIITALDAKTATEALSWAASQSLSVISLAAPLEASPPAYGFVVGEDWATELARLADALAGPRADAAPLTVATVADGEDAPGLVARTSPRVSWRAPISCDAAQAHAGESRFPLAAWNKDGIHAWLVAGDPSCAADLLKGLRVLSRGGSVGLTFEASEMTERPLPGTRLVSVAAGVVPLAAAPPGDPRVADVRAMVSQTGAPARWWAALGRDAAVLAKQSLEHLPADSVSDADAIARRRADVRAGLFKAQAPLWTSEQTGFDLKGVLPRAVRTVELAR